MILPAQKYLRLSKGVTFDYPFLYLSAITGGTSPIPLGNYTATWTINYQGGQTVYANILPLAMVGQLALTNSQPGAMQVGSQGSSAIVKSGVLFGGNTYNPNTGQIDLVITASDTAAISWQSATYLLTLTDSHGVVTELLEGALAVV